jgi:adenosylhomocysteine nucleosidase
MLGIVTGLTAEARLAAPLGTTRAGGGTPFGAARAAEMLIAEGATALISFGLAGGLNPELPPGALLIPAVVLTASRAYETDAALTRALGGPAYSLFADADLAVTAAEKSLLHRSTGADAIDLESGAVAEVAYARAVPFAVLRAICDPGGAALPPAAIVALNASGAINLVRVAGSVLRHPGQLPALLRLAADAAAARAALVRQVAAVAAPLQAVMARSV